MKTKLFTYARLFIGLVLVAALVAAVVISAFAKAQNTPTVWLALSVGNSRTTLTLINPDDATATSTLSGVPQARDTGTSNLGFSADATNIYATNKFSSSIQIFRCGIDGSSCTILASPRIGSIGDAVKVGDFIYFVSSDRVVRFDITNETTTEYAIRGARSIAFNEDVGTFYIATDSLTITEYDADFNEIRPIMITGLSNFNPLYRRDVSLAYYNGSLFYANGRGQQIYEIDIDGVTIQNDVAVAAGTLFITRTSDGINEIGIIGVNKQFDSAPPVFQSASARFSTLTLTYDEPLDTNSVPAAGQFTLRINNNLPTRINEVNVTGSTVVLSLSESLAVGDTAILTYAVPDTNPIQDLFENQAEAFSAETVANDTPAPPTFARLPSIAADTITIVYDELLDETMIPAGGQFTVRVQGGLPAVVSNVAISGQVVTLTIGFDVSSTDVVTLAYQPPQAAGQIGLRTAIGDPVPGFSPTTLLNATTQESDIVPPELRTSTINGSILLLDYKEALNSLSRPSPSVFQINSLTIQTVEIIGSTVSMSVRPPATAGQAYALTYTCLLYTSPSPRDS